MNIDHMFVMTLADGSVINVAADNDNIQKLCAFLQAGFGPDGIPGNSIQKGEILTLHFDGGDSPKLPASL